MLVDTLSQTHFQLWIFKRTKALLITCHVIQCSYHYYHVTTTWQSRAVSSLYWTCPRCLPPASARHTHCLGGPPPTEPAHTCWLCWRKLNYAQ